jgi:hypothetical protein
MTSSPAASVLLLCAVLVPSVIAPRDTPEGGSADAIVRAYNARDFGAPGWRRVSVELLNAGRLVRSFDVVNVWRRTGASVDTLYLLNAPLGLRGTAYLQREAEAVGGFGVDLYLPTAKGRVIALGGDMLAHGLLGSNFSYEDLRWLLPQESIQYRVAGATSMLGRRAVLLDARCAPGTCAGWRRARFYLATEDRFLVGADYFAADDAGSPPFKRLRVELATRAGNVWTAQRMRMDAANQQSTVITLRAFHFGGAPSSDDWYAATGLPGLLARLPASLPDAFDLPARHE